MCLPQFLELGLVDFGWDLRPLYFVEQKLAAGQHLQRLNTSLLVYIPLLLKIKQFEYVGDFLGGEEAGFQALVSFELELLHQELVDVLGLVEAERGAEVLEVRGGGVPRRARRRGACVGRRRPLLVICSSGLWTSCKRFKLDFKLRCSEHSNKVVYVFK